MSNVVADSFPRDPWELLRDWLPSNDDPIRPNMTLSTSIDGQPDARTVLLTEFDDEGFYFHTDALSRKVEQLAANSAVAVMLHFPEQKHQLVVQGAASVADLDELQRAYAGRSDYLKQLSWQNTVEFAQLPQSTRLELWADFQAEHPEELSPPPDWIGFLVRPTRLTFWFGNADTASRRVEYTLTDGEWVMSLRAG